MTIESAIPTVASHPALEAGPTPAGGRAHAARLLRKLLQQWNKFGDIAALMLPEKDRDGAANWQALVEQADARMYQAKRRGKNCVVAW